MRLRSLICEAILAVQATSSTCALHHHNCRRKTACVDCIHAAQLLHGRNTTLPAKGAHDDEHMLDAS